MHNTTPYNTIPYHTTPHHTTHMIFAAAAAGMARDAADKPEYCTAAAFSSNGSHLPFFSCAAAA